MTTPTFRPAWPWYLGGGVAEGTGPSEIGGFLETVPDTITLDGYLFNVNLPEWRSGPVDTFRDSVIASDQPNDTLFNARGAWTRYKYNWHHGQGQALSDLDADADLYRFRKSNAVEWWNKQALKLAHDSDLVQAATVSTNPMLCRSGIYVFLADGTDLYRTPDLITWTTMTDPGGTIQAMSSDGTDLFIATTTKAGKYAGTATVFSDFATPIATSTENIAFVAGRLLIGAANVLKEVQSSGAVTTIKTHFQPAFRWTTIFSIGSRIYVGGFAGTRSELHTLTTDSAGALVVSQEAAPLPAGELLYTGVSYAGSAVLCTSEGLRFAEVSGDGTLTYGPLINEVGACRAACADGRFVFAGWTSMTEGTRCGVMRLAVDDEVAPLQPSYGNDMSQSTTLGNVTGVARIAGKTVFAVAGSGAWAEQADWEGTGSLHSGQITFGTVEPKGLVAISASFAPLITNQSVKLEVIDENGVLIASGIEGTANAETLEIDLGGEQVISCEVVVTLLGPNTSTPTLYRWRMRSYPIPPPVFQWLLPLELKETVVININEGQDYSYDLDVMHLWIEDLYASRRYCVLRVGDRAYRVRVDNFEWRPDSWTKKGEGPQGTLIVQAVAAA